MIIDLNNIFNSLCNFVMIILLNVNGILKDLYIFFNIYVMKENILIVYGEINIRIFFRSVFYLEWGKFIKNKFWFFLMNIIWISFFL